MEYPCQYCDRPVFYNERHDAYGCKICNYWLVSVCEDPKCFYCTDRPERPKEK